jgi:F0F1-type ATP synthase assembly protein I
MPSVTDPVSPRGAMRSSRRGLWSGVDQASVMGVELMAAILVWGGIGWLADRWLGTGPWLLGVGALIGYAAGLYLVWLRSERMNRAEDAARARDGLR